MSSMAPAVPRRRKVRSKQELENFCRDKLDAARSEQELHTTSDPTFSFSHCPTSICIYPQPDRVLISDARRHSFVQQPTSAIPPVLGSSSSILPRCSPGRVRVPADRVVRIRFLTKTG
jgi:hypothetical protein